MALAGPEWARSIEFYWDGTSLLALRGEGSRSGRRDERKVRLALIAETPNEQGAAVRALVDVFDIAPSQGWTRLALLPSGTRKLTFRLERRAEWQDFMTVELVASEVDAGAMIGQWHFLTGLVALQWNEKSEPAGKKSILVSDVVGIEVDPQGHLAHLLEVARNDGGDVVWAVRTERWQVATSPGRGNLEYRISPSSAVYPAIVTGFEVSALGVESVQTGTAKDDLPAIRGHIVQRGPTPGLKLTAARPGDNDRKALGAAAGVIVYRQRHAARHPFKPGEASTAPKVRSLTDLHVIAALQPPDQPWDAAEVEELRNSLFVTPKDESSVQVVRLADVMDGDRDDVVSCQRMGSEYQRPAFRVELPASGYGDEIGICHPSKLLRHASTSSAPLADIVLFRIERIGNEGTTLTPVTIAVNDPCVKEIRQLAARLHSDERQRSYTQGSDKDGEGFLSWLSSLDPSLVAERGAFDDHWESLMGSVVGPQSLAAFLELPLRLPAGMHVEDCFERFLEDPALFSALVSLAAAGKNFAELFDAIGTDPGAPLLERIALALGGDHFVETASDIDTQIAVMSLFLDRPRIVQDLVEARIRLSAPPTSVSAVEEVLALIGDIGRAERALRLFQDEPDLFDYNDRNRAGLARRYLETRRDGRWSDFLDVRAAAEAVQVAEERLQESEKRFVELMNPPAAPTLAPKIATPAEDRSHEEIRAAIEQLRARIAAEHMSGERLEVLNAIPLQGLTRSQLLKVEEELRKITSFGDDPDAVDEVLDAIEALFGAEGVADGVQRRPNGSGGGRDMTRLQRVSEFLNNVEPTYQKAFSGVCSRLNQSRLKMREAITERLASATGRGSITEAMVDDIVRYAELLQISRIHRTASEVAGRLKMAGGASGTETITQISRQLQYFWPIEADETIQQLFEVAEQGSLRAEVGALEQTLQPPTFS